MPDTQSLVVIYLIVLAVFLAGALIYDLRRRYRSQEPAKPSVASPVSRERMGRIVSGRANGVASHDEPSDREPAPAPVVSTPPAVTPLSSEPVSGLTAQGWGRVADPAAVAQRLGEAANPAPDEPPAAGTQVKATIAAPPPSLLDRLRERLLAMLGRKSPAANGAEPIPGQPVRFADDVEFLPAALEILERPPSPIATAMMLGICVMCLTALLWSIVGKLDIHAVAQGKVQPSGRTKVVQPLEAGRVAAIHVESGKLVKEGDLLIELDPTDVAADLEALTRELESVTAEAVRRKSAVETVRSRSATVPELVFPQVVSARVRQREQELLQAEVTQVRSTVEGFKTQIVEREATKKRLQGSIAARGKALGLSKERVGMRDEIRTRGAGSRALVLDAELQYENIAITDASERGQLAETDAGIKSLEARAAQAVDQFIAEQTQKGSEADRRRDRLEQEIVKARSKRDRQQLRAPSGGLVQQIEVSTIGQVVASGQSLMSVVPVDAPLEIEAMIQNKDIGFVRPGQPAVVKVEAFPFTRYGSIDAEVVKVTNDAVEDRNATGMMDAATAARPQANSNPRTQPGQNLVFPAILRLSRRSITVDGKAIPLTPGMAVTVEIKTGERRAISYVLSPLSEIVSTSARER